MQYDLLNSNLTAAYETKLGEAGIGVGMRIGWWAKYSSGQSGGNFCPFALSALSLREGGWCGCGLRT